MADFALINNLAELDRAIDVSCFLYGTYSSAAWQEVIATTSEDADFLLLNVGSTYNYAAYFDIGIGAAGSEDVLVGGLFTGDLAQIPFHGLLPLKIPAGSRLSIRGEVFYSSPRMVNASMVTYAGAFVPGGTYIDVYGSSHDDPSGVVLNWSGAANIKGAWTEITPSTDRDLYWLKTMFSTQGHNNGSGNVSMAYDVAVGAAGSEVAIIADMPLMMTNYDDPLPGGHTFEHLFIPAGSRISARYSYSMVANSGLNLAIAGGG